MTGGAPVQSEDLTLEAADGTHFAAFAALPDESTGVGVVVLPDVRGLYRFYEELALRFAERGYAAVAIDYFGRTAGVFKRDDEFPYMEHVAQTTPAGIQQDTRAAAEFLRSPAGGGCTTVFTVGFCFGGRNAWLSRRAVTGSPARSGSTARRASGTERPGRPSARRSSKRRSSPFRPATTTTSCPSTTLPSRRRSQAAGVEHELVVYDGAPHSFFDRRYTEFADASADAWERVLAFIDRPHAGGAGGTALR